MTQIHVSIIASVARRALIPWYRIGATNDAVVPQQWHHGPIRGGVGRSSVEG